MPRYTVKVIPKSSQNLIEELAPFQFKVKLTASPVGGKANEALIEVLAKHFGIKKSNVRILRGFSSSHKVVEIF